MLMYICSNFDFLYKDTIKTVISKFNNIDKGILDITQHSDKNLLQKELDSKKLELAQLTDKQKLYITDAEINQLLSKIQMAQSDIDSLESDINKHEPDYVRSFLLFLICVLLFYNTYYLTVKRSFTRQQQLQQQQREMLARLRNELSILK